MTWLGVGLPSRSTPQADRRRAPALTPTLTRTPTLALTLALTLTVLRLTADVRKAVEEGSALPPAVGLRSEPRAQPRARARARARARTRTRTDLNREPEA